MGIFRAREQTEVNRLTCRVFDPRSVFSCAFVPPHPQQASSVVETGALQVLSVELLRNIAKICEAVIRAASITVVHVEGRPAASDGEKSQPMRVVLAPKDRNFYVACGLKPTSDIADMRGSVLLDTGEKARLRGVLKVTTQRICGKLFGSHGTVLSWFGQGLGGTAISTSLVSI